MFTVQFFDLQLKPSPLIILVFDKLLVLGLQSAKFGGKDLHLVVSPLRNDDRLRSRESDWILLRATSRVCALHAVIALLIKLKLLSFDQVFLILNQLFLIIELLIELLKLCLPFIDPLSQIILDARSTFQFSLVQTRLLKFLSIQVI